MHKLFPVGLVCAALLLGAGCASTDSATELRYTGADGRSMVFLFPKELDATDLKVRVDAMNGTLRLEAKKWKSRSVEVIRAAGAREAANLKAGSALAEKVASGVTEGLVKGAGKAILPIP